MNKFPLNDEKAQVLGYFSFMGPGEKNSFIYLKVVRLQINQLIHSYYLLF